MRKEDVIASLSIFFVIFIIVMTGILVIDEVRDNTELYVVCEDHIFSGNSSFNVSCYDIIFNGGNWSLGKLGVSDV